MTSWNLTDLINKVFCRIQVLFKKIPRNVKKL